MPGSPEPCYQASRSYPEPTDPSGAAQELGPFAVLLACVLLIAPLPGLHLRILPDMLGLKLIGILLVAGSALFPGWVRRQRRRAASADQVRVDDRAQRAGGSRWVRHALPTALLGMSLGTVLVSGRLHALPGLLIMAVVCGPRIWREPIPRSR